MWWRQCLPCFVNKNGFKAASSITESCILTLIQHDEMSSSGKWLSASRNTTVKENATPTINSKKCTYNQQFDWNSKNHYFTISIKRKLLWLWRVMEERTALATWYLLPSWSWWPKNYSHAISHGKLCTFTLILMFILYTVNGSEKQLPHGKRIRQSTEVSQG